MEDSNRIIVDSMISELTRDSNVWSSFRRIATWNTSYVDYAFQDTVSQRNVALIFVNQFESVDDIKSKAIIVLNSFDSTLICFSSELINEANIFVDYLDDESLTVLPIGIAVYDNKLKCKIIKQIRFNKDRIIKRSSNEQKSYWCWWRDSSHFEVAALLKLSICYDDKQGDIYSEYVYPEFYNMMIDGKTKKWDGTPRKKSFSTSCYSAEKQNYKIPMCQLGLWDAKTGHITIKGRKLYSVVEKYGEESKEFFFSLAKMILVDGKHLDLIKDLDEFQKSCPELIPETSAEFFVMFDDYMLKKNSMGTRKPTAVTTGAKKAYVRDEPKLWNKLGIMKMQSSFRYFKPFKGIEFDWNKINEILLSNYIGG